MMSFTIFGVNAPVTTVGRTCNAVPGQPVTVPITVTGFTDIGSFYLFLEYDHSKIQYVSAAKNPLLTGNYNINDIDLGGNIHRIILSWSGGLFGKTLTDGSAIVNLVFNFISGPAELKWNTSSDNFCAYTDRFVNRLNDSPKSSYYINGFVSSTSSTTPSITAGGSTTFCQGGSVTLTSSTGPAYLWTTGETTQSISATTTGSYFVTITDAVGCGATSNPINVVVHEVPKKPVITAKGPTTFCEGGSVTLTSSEALNYKWSTGETTPSITVSTSGSYTVSVTSAEGCIITSDAMEVVAATPAQPTIFAEGLTTFCEGGSVTLTPSAGYEYIWSNGETSQSITVSTSGIYWVKVSSVEGCQSVPSESIEVIVITKPAEPTNLECWQTATFNNTTCEWDVTGTKPAEPTPVNCWDDYVFFTASCSWVNQGSQPVEPIVYVVEATCSTAGSASITNYKADYTYAFTPAGPVVDDNGNISGFTTGQTYTVKGINTDNCESAATAPFTIQNILEAPTAGITNNTGETQLTCTCTSISVTATGGVSYSWSDGTNVVGTEADLMVTVPGTYTVTVTADNGCTATASINITIEDQVKPTFTQLGPYCIGHIPDILPSTSNEGIQGTWSPASISTAYAGSLTYTFTPNPGECADETTMTVVVNSCNDGTFCTYTIGFYGNRGENACVVGETTNAYGIMISALNDAGGYYTFGSEFRNFTLHKTDILMGNIFRILPGGGTAKAFTGSSTYVNLSSWKHVPLSDKRATLGRSQNILFSQLLAYYFNLNINPGLANFKIENVVMGTAKVMCGSNQIIPGSKEEYFVFPASILNYLRASSAYNADGQGLFNLANDAIGGKVTGINLNDLANALTFMNEGFNECRSLVGWYSKTPGKKVAIIAEMAEIAKPKVSVYPNPFSDRVFFEFDFNTDGNALLEIYDIKGSKISTLYNNRVESGVKYRIEYSPENVVPGMLLYRLVKDGRVFQGKLIYK